MPEEDLESVLEGFDDHQEKSKTPDELDDVLKGFEEEGAEEPDKPAKKENEKPAFAELSGSISLGASIAYAHEDPGPGEADYPGLNRLRPDLHLELDLNISKQWKAKISGRAFYDLAFLIKGRDRYGDGVLDLYEKEAELQDAYIQGPLLDNLDVKFGRQIVVWGRSDNIRVVDILNPLDNREPGLVDIEDLRLPVTMTKLDYYVGKWNLSAIGVHEIRFNKTPVGGSEFLSSQMKLPDEIEPVNSLENMEYALSLNGIFSGWDLSFYWARYFDDQPHIEVIAPGSLEGRHSRLGMIGAALNVALGNWLVKGETAYISGIEYYGLPGEEKNRLDVLVGVEYSGFSNTIIAFEAVNRHIGNFDSRLDNILDGAREDDFQAVLRYSGDFMHDQLHLVALMSVYGVDGKGGSFERFSVGYDLADPIALTFGVVMYQSGDRRELRQIGDNDRFFIELKYSF